MCILFLHVEPSPSPSQYRLVLASNRDEYYARPSRQAQFWEDNPHILAGQDREPIRGGGTWLGMNKTGKIGIILNVLMGNEKRDDAKGRGFLVVDYLNSKKNGLDYLKDLSANGNAYNYFNLVTIDLSATEEPQLAYYTNKVSDDPQLLPLGTHTFGNSMMSSPLRKVQEGKTTFKDILGRHPEVSSKAQLTQELLQLLKSEKRFLPDSELEKTGVTPSFLEALSSNYVKAANAQYGSRTHTVILVDGKGEVDFLEWTMQEPIDSRNPTWQHVNFHFNLFQSPTCHAACNDTSD